jgi:hypothetical protein
VRRLSWLLPFLVLGAACGGKLPSGPSGTLPLGTFEVLQASARIAESYPAQVTLELEGRLPNVCSTLLPVTQTRDGNRVRVGIQTRATSEVCILLLPAPMRLDVPLQGGFTAGDYVVTVNDFELRFHI